MYNRLEIVKAFYNAGLITTEDYIETLWEIGMLTYDEALDLIVKENSNKRRNKH